MEIDDNENKYVPKGNAIDVALLKFLSDNNLAV